MGWAETMARQETFNCWDLVCLLLEVWQYNAVFKQCVIVYDVQLLNDFLFFPQESPIHRHLFWVAISVLQLDEVSLYASGLALLEQNLHTLDNVALFEKQVSPIGGSVEENTEGQCGSTGDINWLDPGEFQ